MTSNPHDLASTKVEALLQIEVLVDGGMKVRRAVETVSEKTGIAVRTLFRYRQLTDFVPREDWPTALSRRPRPKSFHMKSECHRAALCGFVDLCRKGTGISESYRRITALAEAEGWGQIPSERTLRRELTRHVAPADLRRARRDAGSVSACV